MGDRANVLMQGNDSKVYLYTHWGGCDLAGVVVEAMKRRQRWNDVSYLGRIIFCAMVNGCEDRETGFGISTYMPDNEHAIIVVDTDLQEVRLTNEKGQLLIGTSMAPCRWSFESVCEDAKVFLRCYENWCDLGVCP